MTLIREMTSNHGLDSDGDVVIEAVRRAEEEEVAVVKIIIAIVIILKHICNYHIEKATKAKTLGEKHSLHVLHWSDRGLWKFRTLSADQRSLQQPGSTSSWSCW